MDWKSETEDFDSSEDDLNDYCREDESFSYEDDCNQGVASIDSQFQDKQSVHLSEDLGAMLRSEEFSDVTFIVQNKSFRAHKFILAARSKYFRALLFGGMKESQTEAAITLEDSSAASFQQLLQYIYTAEVDLENLELEDVFHLYSIANMYGFTELERCIWKTLPGKINIITACPLYKFASLYSLTDLVHDTIQFIDKNAEDMLKVEYFMNLSVEEICNLIGRDSFYATETNIFRVVQRWCEDNPLDKSDETGKAKRRRLLSLVRLPLMSLQDLNQIVKPTGLMSNERITEAKQKKNNITYLKYRGCLLPEENVCAVSKNAQICLIGSKFKESEYIKFKGFDYAARYLSYGQRIPIKKSAVIKLDMPYILNHITMYLETSTPHPIKSKKSHIKVSVDGEHWVTVVHYFEYPCIGEQKLHFPSRPVRYIKIEPKWRSFELNVHTFEAKYTKKSLEIKKKGFIVPGSNIKSRIPSFKDNIAITHLCRPRILTSMRMKIFSTSNNDTRFSFYIEVSTNKKDWKRIVNKGNQRYGALQDLTFPKIRVFYIRIVVTSSHRGFLRLCFLKCSTTFGNN